MLRTVFIILIAVVAFVIGAGLFPLEVKIQQPVLQADPEVQYKVYRTDSEEKTIQVYKDVNEAVVFISTATVSIDPFDWFPELKPQKGSGSGIIVDAEEGLIITNLHVISNAQKIEIVLADGKKYPAKRVGYDQEYDLAVLRLQNPPKNLTAIPFGDSKSIEVGQRVLAIGNPFGLNRTLTTGIISSMDRTLKTPSGTLLKGLIQTDAAINPGNSGGPLLDSSGRLIGINTVILSQSGDSAGIGFAIPINRIKRILPELIATGRVLRPQLGWIIIDTNQGPLVRRVMQNSPAEVAGIQPLEKFIRQGFLSGYIRDYENADLIHKINGKVVESKSDVDEALELLKSQDSVVLVLRRGGLYGKERIVKLKPVWQ